MKEKLVVGLNGPAGAGKDTAADYMKQFGFQRLAFADKLKESVYNLDPILLTNWKTSKDAGVELDYIRVSNIVDSYGWDWAKHNIHEVRRLLQREGTEVGRDLYGEDFWVDQIRRQINVASTSLFVITDMRFPNEFDFVKKENSGYIIRIDRPGNPLDIGTGHASEQHKPEADYTIVNEEDKLNDFYAQIVTAVRSIFEDWESRNGDSEADATN